MQALVAAAALQSALNCSLTDLSVHTVHRMLGCIHKCGLTNYCLSGLSLTV